MGSMCWKMLGGELPPAGGFRYGLMTSMRLRPLSGGALDYPAEAFLIMPGSIVRWVVQGEDCALIGIRRR